MSDHVEEIEEFASWEDGSQSEASAEHLNREDGAEYDDSLLSILEEDYRVTRDISAYAPPPRHHYNQEEEDSSDDESSNGYDGDGDLEEAAVTGDGEEETPYAALGDDEEEEEYGDYTFHTSHHPEEEEEEEDAAPLASEDPSEKATAPLWLSVPPLSQGNKNLKYCTSKNKEAYTHGAWTVL